MPHSHKSARDIHVMMDMTIDRNLIYNFSDFLIIFIHRYMVDVENNTARKEKT